MRGLRTEDADRIERMTPAEVYLEFFSHNLEAQHQIAGGHVPDEETTAYMRFALYERAAADERERVA
jgi:hypothetical protein